VQDILSPTISAQVVPVTCAPVAGGKRHPVSKNVAKEAVDIETALLEDVVVAVGAGTDVELAAVLSALVVSEIATKSTTVIIFELV